MVYSSFAMNGIIMQFKHNLHTSKMILLLLLWFNIFLAMALQYNLDIIYIKFRYYNPFDDLVYKFL
jgi:hypothetical protein